MFCPNVISLIKTEVSIKRRLVKKRLEFFWALAYEKTKLRHDLPPLLSRILCSLLVFVDDLFLVCFQERLRISFSRYFSLDISLFTYAFSRSLRVPLAVFCLFWRLF